MSQGEFIVAGATYAKVRNLEAANKKTIKSAGPSTPVTITGFKELPRFGEEFVSVKDEKVARKISEENKNKLNNEERGELTSGDLIRILDKQKQINELNIIVKADVQGSLKSVLDSLRSMNTDEVAVRIVGSGIGNVNEKDAHLAATSGAIIYAFNVDALTKVRQLANRDEVKILEYKVIYELLDDIKEKLTTLLAPEIIRTDIGRLIVKGIFKITKEEVICGGEVTKGKLQIPALAKVIRDDKVLTERVEIIGLQRGPQEVKEVQNGEMCGVRFKSDGRVAVEEGDKLEFYKVETKIRTL